MVCDGTWSMSSSPVGGFEASDGGDEDVCDGLNRPKYIRASAVGEVTRVAEKISVSGRSLSNEVAKIETT
jgi:hypothetical protein